MLKVNLLNDENLVVSATKKVITSLFGSSLKALLDNVDFIINDTSLNRLMRELDFLTQKGMTSSATMGYGGSAGYFIIKGSTICKILKKQIESKKEDIEKENSKSIPDSDVIEAIEGTIKSLEDYINYFFPKSEYYFIINGQHRFDSIKNDYNNTIVVPKKGKGKGKKKGSKKGKTQTATLEQDIKYSSLEVTIGNETYRESVESLFDLKQKLLSVVDGFRYEWAKDLNLEQRTAIWNNYLDACQIYIIEITEADSFLSIMEFVRKSNQSTEWDDFLYRSVQSMSAYTRWFRTNLITDKTNQMCEYEKLFYSKESPLSKGMAKGSFSRTNGGWQYLIGNLMLNCYAQPSVGLPLFRVSTKPDIEKALFEDASLFSNEWGESLLSDIIKITACIKELDSKPNSKIFSDTYKKASFFIYCLYAYNYYKKYYFIRNGKDKYRLNINDGNLQQFIIDICLVCFTHSSIATDDNTNFWKTDEGKAKIAEWKSKGALKKASLEHPTSAKDLLDEFQKEWPYIIQQCEKNETKDKEKSFGRHFIGDLISWGNDHTCVVNVINNSIQLAFEEVLVECKTPTKPFSKIGFVSVSELPKASELVTSDYDDLYDLLNSDEETDRAHNKARNKGGSSEVYNVNMGSRKINRKQKDVV